MQTLIGLTVKQTGARPDSRVNRARPVLTLLALLPIFAYYLWNLCFVSTAGNFPLNDDWLYSAAVKVFMETGQLRLAGCSAACFAHVVAGAATTYLFGFSHEVLRAQNYLLSLTAVVALFFTLKELGVRRAVSSVAAMTLAVNPIWVNLSFSNMTDVSAAALVNLYLLFLVRSLKNATMLNATLAAICLIAAIATRQTAVVFVGLNLVAVVLQLRRGKPAIVLAFLSVVLPLLSFVCIDKAMTQMNLGSTNFGWYRSEFKALLVSALRAPLKLLPALMIQVGKTSFYLGLFTLPLLPAFLPALAGIKSKQRISPVWYVAATAAITAVCVDLVYVKHALMPFNQNLLRLPELGAHTIMGVNLPPLANKWRVLLTDVSAIAGWTFLLVIGAGAVFASRRLKRVLVQKQGGGTDLARGICFLAGLVAIGFVVLQTIVWDLDRYYVMALPPAIMAVAVAASYMRARHLMAIAVPVLVIFGAYASAAQQDYMAWNRARWSELARLELAGVPSSAIDGGSEFDYLRNPQLNEYLALSNGSYAITHRGKPPRDQWRWWPITGEEYIVSFSPVPEYQEVSKQSYWSALTLGRREILTLKGGDSDATLSRQTAP
jgi:hypothetical protein